ncbi:putative orphan protein; putative acyltransferase [Pseudoalteromonas translucida]|uniref:Orphan protein putative acyltransferase n=2 Tax=Pseudoalteromonas translucida TaxID=166935 RepID=Q3IIG4_PSET1|nr:putative orphan protein; putative acyltransferase [Pseudoalteromonas translucida]
MIVNTPNESNQVVNQAIFGSTFISNIGFWLQNSYFSKAEFNPLLHLWSLGVEIQFYLIVPILAWFFSKTRFSLVFIVIVSMALCFIVLTISPKTSFFMMPLRLWEFLLGYGVALYLTQSGAVKFPKQSWLGFVGLILILLIPFFNVNGESLSIILGHPGAGALLVSIATSIVLVFGLPKIVEKNIISKGLAILGKYSYSIYLIHFPVIVLYLSEPFMGTILDIPNVITFIIIFALIFTLSFTLHKLVETRNFNISITKLSVIFIALIIGLAIIGPWIKTNFISNQEKSIFNAFNDRSTYRCGKLIRITNPTTLTCNLSEDINDTVNKVMLVGNSHADSIKTTFIKVAAKHNQAVYFIVQNNPLMAGGLSPDIVVREAISKEVKHIVVHFSPSGISVSKLKELVFLAEKNSIKITFIDPVPVWESHIPKMMYRQLKGFNDNELQTKDDYLSFNNELFTEVDNISNDNFKRISIADYFCTPNCSYKLEDGTPFYFDSGHLTLTGSNVIEKALNEAISAGKYSEN